MAQWKIANNLPYLEEFAELIEINEYPKDLWRINSDLPYKLSFPVLYNKFDEVPNGLWVIDSMSNVPYKKSFVEMCRPFTGVPKEIWAIKDDIPFKYVFPEKFALWNINELETIEDDLYFSKSVDIGDRILRAVDLNGNEAIRHITIIPPNLGTTEKEFNLNGILQTEDGLFLELEDEYIWED